MHRISRPLIISAPRQRLAVQIREAAEAAGRQEVGFDVKKRALDSPLSVDMTDRVSLEPEAQCARKGDHLGGADGVRAGAVSDHDTGTVDHAERTSTVHEPRRFEKEVFGLEASEFAIVLDEQPTRISQHQSGAVRGDRLAGDHHAVWRCDILQHVDALDQRRGIAQPATAFWRISARPGSRGSI
jgi:hypothetical protein